MKTQSLRKCISKLAELVVCWYSTCAQLLQVVAQPELDLGQLQGDAHGGHEPGGETRVHAGAGGQGGGRHQLVTLELRAGFTV